MERYASIISKIMPFFNFRKYAKKIIKKRKYSKLIILTTQTAILFPDILFGKYKNKYFFDYRDTSYEYYKPYSWLVNSIIKKSFSTSISSPGFKKYLTDKKDIVIAHNFQDKYYKNRNLTCEKKSNGEKTVMGYIGVLREYDYLIKIIDCFGKDERFEFHIYGGGDDCEKIKEYAKKFSNIFVYGAYDENDKCNIINSFDMICYNYPYSFVNYPAVANKFYDGMIMKKPMFGNKRTFSGELIEKNGLGISIDEKDENIADKIYNYYQNFSAEEFSENCEQFLKTVINDDKKYVNEIEKFIKS